MYELDIPISSLLPKVEDKACQIEADKESIRKLIHDSRKLEVVRSDDKIWFICLTGKTKDGHEFVDELIQKGVHRFIYEKNKIRKPIPGLQVEDTNFFLAELASFWRRHCKPIVIAITGSNGKTSTKELLYFILRHIFEPGCILKSKASFNNHFGVPFTLLEMNADTRYVVLELGSNYPGEIRFLSQTSAPNYGLITSIGLGHIGHFNTPIDIAEEKSDILAGMPLNSNLFFPENMNFSENISEKASQKEIHVNFSSLKRLGIQILEEGIQGTKFSYGGENFILPAPGEHQMSNLCLILTFLERLEAEKLIDSSKILDALTQLKSFRGLKDRMNVISYRHFRICNDSYNANPSSFTVSIKTLAKNFSMEALLGVFGYMAELGDFELEEHKKLAGLTSNYFKAVVFLSPNRNVAQAFRDGWLEEKRKPEELFLSGIDEKDLAEAARFLHPFLSSESCVLIKGSRSAQTERILNYLK